MQKIWAKFERDHPNGGGNQSDQMQVGYVKIYNFQQITRYISIMAWFLLIGSRTGSIKLPLTVSNLSHPNHPILCN